MQRCAQTDHKWDLDVRGIGSHGSYPSVILSFADTGHQDTTGRLHPQSSSPSPRPCQANFVSTVPAVWLDSIQTSLQSRKLPTPEPTRKPMTSWVLGTPKSGAPGGTGEPPKGQHVLGSSPLPWLSSLGPHPTPHMPPCPTGPTAPWEAACFSQSLPRFPTVDRSPSGAPFVVPYICIRSYLLICNIHCPLTRRQGTSHVPGPAVPA